MNLMAKNQVALFRCVLRHRAFHILNDKAVLEKLTCCKIIIKEIKLECIF